MHTSASPEMIDGQDARLLLLGADGVDHAGDHHGDGEAVVRRARLLELVEQHAQLDRVALAEAGHGPLEEALARRAPGCSSGASKVPVVCMRSMTSGVTVSATMRRTVVAVLLDLGGEGEVHVSPPGGRRGGRRGRGTRRSGRRGRAPSPGPGGSTAGCRTPRRSRSRRGSAGCGRWRARRASPVKTKAIDGERGAVGDVVERPVDDAGLVAVEGPRRLVGEQAAAVDQDRAGRRGRAARPGTSRSARRTAGAP